MTFIKYERIDESKYDPFPSRETATELKPLRSTLKYAFLDHQCANPVILSS